MMARWLLVAVLAGIPVACLGDAAEVRAVLGDDPLQVTNYSDEVVVYVRDLDLLRARAGSLIAQVALDGEACAVDLAAPCQTPAIVVRKPEGASPSAVRVTLLSDGEEVLERSLDLGTVVTPRSDIPLSGQRAFIEPGQSGITPEIARPDLGRLRTEALTPAERVVDFADATVRVRTETNYPLISANNNCAISGQTAHPGDLSQRSLYVPVKSQLFDQQTGDPTVVAHYLVEVPLSEEWLAGEEDLEVSLPPEAIRVHTSERKWPEGSPSAQALLGQGAGGLGQLTGVVDVDERGRIYFSRVPSGLVRFDPATAEWETPPIDVNGQIAQFLPSVHDVPDDLKRGELALRWEGYQYIAIMRGRVFYAPIITAIYQREDRTTFVFAGLLSMPVDHWDDPDAFTQGIRFHVGSWPGCEHSFFEGWSDPEDRTRKLGRLYARDDGLYIKAYKSAWGGPWKLEFDDEGNTISFGLVDTIPPDTRAGLPTAASGLADWWGYGTVAIERAKLHRVLRGSTADLPGSVQINYDAIAAIRLHPERYGDLLAANNGPSLAPVYMATPIPGQADTVLGSAEYGYYLATFDLSHADEGYITKTYLKRDLGATALELPLAVGLGPYGYVWSRDGDRSYLYVGGYTGLTRLVYRSDDLAPDHYRMEDFTYSIETNRLDEAGVGAIKRFRYLLPGLDGRIFLTGTHSAARGGTSYSGGLMSFVAADMSTLDKLSFMGRCYSTTILRGRVVHRLGAPPVQQLLLAGSGFSESYAFTLDQELVPANHDPRIFAYEYESGGAPRSMYGFSLPPEDGERVYRGHCFDRTRRYLIVLQGSHLMTVDARTWRFADGVTLSADGLVTVVRFFRPSQCFTRSPDDRVFIYATVGEAPTQGTFYEVDVDEDGSIALRPHLTLRAGLWPRGAGREAGRRAEDAARLSRTVSVVRTFVPDLSAGDGSCDLLLGVPFRAPGTDARLIRDFIPPRRR